MHPDVNTSDACFSSHLLLKMFSFASIEFTSFTRRTLQFGIQFEDAWNCSRGGGNVFSLDQVSAEHRLQLLCLLAPFPTFLRMDPEGGELGRWPFARTRECVDGEKEIEGNILEGGELRRMGCCW